ncbi:MAG: ATP-grasp domain-containing protein [Caldilineaceae bacterium]
MLGAEPPRPFLVESYIPGVEVALEGILDNGRLQVLALFDKPDPLEGPFFEETIYVTPSRLPADTQQAIADCMADTAGRWGCTWGRSTPSCVNEDGPWIVEIAGRSIGGLCSRTLRFGVDASLEELILRQACGLPIESLVREDNAGGVMDDPDPRAGHPAQRARRRRSVRGGGRRIGGDHRPFAQSARAVARRRKLFGLHLRPRRHRGRGETSLREAHACLQFGIEEEIPLWG